jgi:hypothetical protein
MPDFIGTNGAIRAFNICLEMARDTRKSQAASGKPQK